VPILIEGMLDLSRMDEILVILPALLGLVTLLWAWRITAQGREREREVRRLSEEAHTIKNDFVALVSHELRTPLTSIAGFSDTLLESWSTLPQEEINEFLTIINRQALYLGDLVEDVLVIPRLEANRLRLDPELFDLGDLIEDVAQMVFPNGGRKSSLVSLPDGVRVFADRRRVHQVIRNVMENARKYGGDQILVEGFVLGDQYLIIVSDNGPGVRDEETQKVFEDFEQLSKGDARDSTGMGLGLPIARRLARAMGGDVWYERRFPTGARFCYSLPLNRRNVLVEDGPERQPQADEMVRVELPDVEASRAV
jgi:two-component system phosphate regulon sensor histidine kinase PhoR